MSWMVGSGFAPPELAGHYRRKRKYTAAAMTIRMTMTATHGKLEPCGALLACRFRGPCSRAGSFCSRSRSFSTFVERSGRSCLSRRSFLSRDALTTRRCFLSSSFPVCCRAVPCLPPPCSRDSFFAFHCPGAKTRLFFNRDLSKLHAVAEASRSALRRSRTPAAMLLGAGPPPRMPGTLRLPPSRRVAPKLSGLHGGSNLGWRVCRWSRAPQRWP